MAAGAVSLAASESISAIKVDSETTTPATLAASVTALAPTPVQAAAQATAIAQPSTAAAASKMVYHQHNHKLNRGNIHTSTNVHSNIRKCRSVSAAVSTVVSRLVPIEVAVWH